MLSMVDGLLMGAANGISPGPLLTLVIAQTLQYGMREGTKISLTPIIGGLPVIILSFLAYVFLAKSSVLLAIISFIGGVFLLMIGISHLKTKPFVINQKLAEAPKGSILKGTLATLLNPGAYAFWISVGAPLAFKSFENGYTDIILFLVFFFLAFISANLAVVVITSKTTAFLSGPSFVWVMRILGAVLIVYSVMFFKDGISKVGWL